MGRIHWGLPLLEGLLPAQIAVRIATDGAVDPSLKYDEPPNNGAYIFDGVSGDILKDLNVSGRIVRVSRQKLRALCSEGINVHWGHALLSVECDDHSNSVTAAFSDGQSYTGTVLVGCDGPRSAVRNHLFMPDRSAATARPMEGIVTTSMCVTYADPNVATFVRSKTHPVWCIAISPVMFHFMSIQDVPDPERPETWRFFFFNSWLGEKPHDTSGSAARSVLLERAENLAEVREPLVMSSGLSRKA